MTGSSEPTVLTSRPFLAPLVLGGQLRWGDLSFLIADSLEDLRPPLFDHVHDRGVPSFQSAELQNLEEGST